MSSCVWRIAAYQVTPVNLFEDIYTKSHAIQRNIAQLMTSNYFQDRLTEFFDVIQSNVGLQKQVH